MEKNTFFKKIYLKFKNPSPVFCAISAVICIAAVVGAIVCIIFARTHPAAFALYAFSLASLLYLVYLIILGVEKFKPLILSYAEKHKFTNQLVKDYGFRSVVLAGFTAIINVAFAVYNGVLGIANSSVWYASLFFYFLLLAFLRGNVLFRVRKVYLKMQAGSYEREEYEIKNYLRTGIYLLILSLALVAAVAQVVMFGTGFEVHGLLIYVFAAYTFYKAVISVIQSMRVRKLHDFTAQSIRDIGLADALVSILALQTALFAAFDTDNSEKWLNAVTGVLVCALTIALGIYVICRAVKHLKLIKYQ